MELDPETGGTEGSAADPEPMSLEEGASIRTENIAEDGYGILE
jgi:hypothetical protein